MINRLAKTCPTEFTLQVLGGKWKTAILCYLKVRPLRYAELRRLLPKFSDKMLSQRLRELTDAGLVARRKELDGKAELYTLAPRARSLSRILTELYRWGDSNAAEFGVKVTQPLIAMPVKALEKQPGGSARSAALAV